MRRGRRRREDNPAQLRFALSGASVSKEDDDGVPPRPPARVERRRQPTGVDGDPPGRSPET